MKRCCAGSSKGHSENAVFTEVLTNLDLLKIISAFACPLDGQEIVKGGLIHVLQIRPQIYLPFDAIGTANRSGHSNIVQWLRDNRACTLCKNVLANGICAVCGIGSGYFLFIRPGPPMLEIAKRSPDYSIEKLFCDNELAVELGIKQVGVILVYHEKHAEIEMPIIIENNVAWGAEWMRAYLYKSYPKSDIRLHRETRSKPLFKFIF